MTMIEADALDYLRWMRVHNYAATTIACRQRYLAYLTSFCRGQASTTQARSRLRCCSATSSSCSSTASKTGSP